MNRRLSQAAIAAALLVGLGVQAAAADEWHPLAAPGTLRTSFVQGAVGGCVKGSAALGQTPTMKRLCGCYADAMADSMTVDELEEVFKGSLAQAVGSEVKQTPALTAKLGGLFFSCLKAEGEAR